MIIFMINMIIKIFLMSLYMDFDTLHFKQRLQKRRMAKLVISSSNKHKYHNLMFES